MSNLLFSNMNKTELNETCRNLLKKERKEYDTAKTEQSKSIAKENIKRIIACVHGWRFRRKKLKEKYPHLNL